MKKHRKALIVYDAILDLAGVERTVGGIQTYLLSLAKVFEQVGMDVTIVQEGNVDFESRLDDVRIVGRRVSGANSKNKYAKLLASVESDFSSHETLVIWGTFYNVPLQSSYTAISIQHGIGFDLINESKRNTMLCKMGLAGLIKYVQRRQAYKSYTAAEYRVCVDYNFLNWYRTMSSRKDDANTWVIPNFTEIPDWEVRPRPTNRKVLFARRFVSVRGVNLMLDAARNLLPVYLDMEVTFAGAGPGLPEIKKLQDDFPDRVAITRYEPNQSLEFHRGYDIAVIPTFGSEGTSLSLLEAMASGCAVVCTNVGGMTNIVIDRYNGLMVNPDANSIHDAIRCLFDSSETADRMRTAARQTVEAGFSKKLWAEKWTRVIHGLA